MTHLAMKLLGTYHLFLDGMPINAQETDKARALLAYLAIENDRPHSREKLAGIFWSEQNEEHARGSLSQALYQLRGLLGDRPHTGGIPTAPRLDVKEPYLFVSPHEIQFNPRSDFEIDVDVFNRLVSVCKAHGHPAHTNCDQCLERYQDAARLYVGDFLDGFYLPRSLAFEEWATVLREQLRLEVLSVLEQLVNSFEQLRDLDHALEYARKIVQLDELSEAGNLQVMRLLATSGRRGEALAQYVSFHHTLLTQIGDEPGIEIRSLYRRLQKEESGLRVGNLTAGLMPLIGRRQELAQLNQYLNDPGCRVLTILGPGGCGKTRLALEVVRAVQYNFQDGVYLVSLSALNNAQAIVPAVAEAIHFGFREQTKPSQQLLDYLCPKKILLLMDSFEAILTAAAWVVEVLAAAPGVKFLITSRSSLKIREEQVFPLEGMPVPEEGELEWVESNDAVQLFLAFARHRLPAFMLDEATYPHLVRICCLVHGLPLGLLLASSWVQLYSLKEIAEQIEHNLDFLSVDWSDMPPRQRSLQATFNYSWDLLSDEEQRFFTALSVFKGSFSLQAIHYVAGKPVRLLNSLLNKSLVSHISADRYQLHDLVWQYANTMLEQDGNYAIEIRNRHSRFFLEALSLWSKSLVSSRQRETLDAMDQEVENLRVAWRWAVAAQDWEGIAQGLEGMGWYADLRFRFQEGELACRIVLEALSAQSYPHLFSTLTIWRAHFLCRTEQKESARKLLHDEAERLTVLHLAGEDTRSLKAQALYELGELNMYTDRYNAREYYQQSLSLYDEIDDSRGKAQVLTSLGEAIHHTGPLDLAQVLLDRGVDLCRKLGDPRLLSRCILWNGWNQLRQGNLAQAESLIRESIEINRIIGDRYAEAFWSAELGTVKAWMGYFDEGIHLISSSIPIFTELGLKQEATLNILRRGLFRSNLMDFSQAALDYQKCLTSSYELNYQRGIGGAIFGMGGISLNDGDYKKAGELLLQALTIMSGVQADEAGWCLALLVYTMRLMGDPARGWKYAYQGLELARSAHVYHSAAMTILGIVMLLADLGEFERAIELHALVMKYPLFKSSAWFHNFVDQSVETASANLPPDIVRAASEKGAERELFATVDELLIELSRNPLIDNSG